MPTLFKHDFLGIIAEAEVSLCIDGNDYASRDIDQAIDSIKNKIERQFGIDFNYSLNEMVNGSSIMDEASTFVDSVYYIYCRLCACSQYFRYIGEIPVKPKAINYAGYTKNSFLGLMRLLTIDGKYESVEQSVEQLKYRLGTIPMCVERKLLMILVICYGLNLYEMVACIAELLYIGGTVE